VAGFALAWGVLAFLGFCLGLIPCLGALNWLNIPFAFGGVAVSIVAMARSRHAVPGSAIAGLFLSVCAVVLGFVRLVLGGGLL